MDSGDWKSRFLRFGIVDRVLSEHFQQGDQLVSGGAAGADSLAERWCKPWHKGCSPFGREKGHSLSDLGGLKKIVCSEEAPI